MEGPEGALTSCHISDVWQTHTENVFIYYLESHKKRDKSIYKKKDTMTALVILTLIFNSSLAVKLKNLENSTTATEFLVGC